ncbi:MAG: TatD family hydrolase [Verrucomicrobia bacterium]|nr:TatD family hydrolase [Verrucomicrobiota bacterium]
MPPIFYDTHAHLDSPDFAADLPGLVERAAAAGITRIISIGTDLDSSRRAIELAEKFHAVYAAAGWHPNDAVTAPEDFRAELRALAQHPKVVAIGETGLDYYRLPTAAGGSGGTAEDDARAKAKQAAALQQQLEVAAVLGLNCIIHQRGDCLEDTLALLRPFAGRVRFVFHCFVGTPAEAERIRGIGGLVSFTGIATFKNGETVRASAAAEPELMLETDAPFLAPVPYRGKRCEPAYVREIATAVAQARGCTLEELSALTCATAHKFFPKLA